MVNRRNSYAVKEGRLSNDRVCRCGKSAKVFSTALMAQFDLFEWVFNEMELDCDCMGASALELF
jgi:hypothetical protein